MRILYFVGRPVHPRLSSECAPEILERSFFFFLLRSHAAVDGSFSCALMLLRTFSAARCFRMLRVLPSQLNGLRATATDYDVHGFVLNARRQRTGHECDEKSLDVSRGGSLQSSS